MKLKELPNSLLKTLELACLDSNKIKKTTEHQLPVIISLTSIEPRLKTLYIVIKSLLIQDKKSEKIILWLNHGLKNKIPNSLKKLEGPIFQIKFSHLDCPHLKLIETLKNYPDYNIITVDDDFIYSPKLTTLIYNQHLKEPHSIIANRVRHIAYNENGALKKYKEWNSNKNTHPNHILPLGVDGVLYPPNCFSKTVFDEELFSKLAPKSDDLWFKAMSLINNTPSTEAINKPKFPIPIAGTQWVALKKTNVHKDMNRKQWKDLTDYFNLKI